MKYTQYRFLTTVSYFASVSVGMSAVTAVTGITTSGVVGNYDLYTVTVSTEVYTINELKTGTTTNNTIPTPTALPLLDDTLLGTGHGNVGNSPTTSASLPVRTVFTGGFNSVATILKPADFFIFEMGASGGDTISVAAIIGGTVSGTSVSITGASWGNTGVVTESPAFQSGQTIRGASFSITDLFDLSGVALTTSSTIDGIAITAGGGVDPVGIFAVIPEPSSMALALLGLGGLTMYRRRSR